MSERLEPLQLAHLFERYFIKCSFGVRLNDHSLTAIQPAACIFVDCRTKAVQLFPFYPEPSRQFMAAVFLKHIGTMSKRLDKVESLYAPSASFALFSVK